MKKSRIDPELEREIEQYVNGDLNDAEIEELWMKLIQNEEALDYLKTVANLKKVIEEKEEVSRIKSGDENVIGKYSTWYVAAAAAILMIVGTFGIMQMTNDSYSVDPIATIELDYYRSADGTVGNDNGEAAIREAIVLANQGLPGEAVEVIESELIQVSAPNAKASLYINAGSILYNASMYEEASVHFENVIELVESDPLIRERAYWYLGNTFFQLNKLEEARAAFQEAYELNGAYSRVAQSYLRALAIK